MNACIAIERPTQTPRKRVAKSAKSKRPMSREEAKYWGLWSEIFRKFNIPQSQHSQWRRDLRMQCLGSERTQVTFSHGDYDVILGAMRELLNQASLIVYPEKVLQIYMEGEIRRAIKLIENLNLPEAYVASISRGKFVTSDWRGGLLAHELMQLFYTCKARKTSAEKKGKTFYTTESQPAEESDFVDPDSDDYIL